MNLLFAWRYFRSKKTTNAVNIIAWISVLAILVTTASLIVVLSVFNGFESLVKGLYSDFYADMKIAPKEGKFLTLDSTVINKIQRVKGVANASMIVEEKSVLVNGEYQTIVFLKGVDENYKQVSKLQNHIARGKYYLGTIEEPAIVAGAGIANAVGADPMLPLQNIVMYLPNRKAKNFSSLDGMHSYNINTAGIFTVQQEFDDKYAFTNMSFVKYMLDLDENEYSGMELKLLPGANSTQVKNDIGSITNNNYKVLTRYEQNQSLFAIMRMEKWIIYAILSLILLVAAFNMIGALTMLVLEKEKDIAVLKAMGANDKRIRNIFLSEGFLLAAIGGVSGMVLAFLICIAQIKLHIVKLQGATFIIDYYPVKMNAEDFILVALTVLFVASLASWLPAKKASAKLFSLKS